MNWRTWHLGVIVVAVGLLAGCNFGDMQSLARVSEDFAHTYPLRAGGDIEVSTRNGSVEVLGWEKESIEITGSKYASSQKDVDDIEIQIDANDAAVRIKALFPGSTRGGKGARFVIRAPRTAIVRVVDTSNGSIRVEDMARVGRLNSSNASITVNRSEGPLVADTSNGAIRISQTPGDLKLDTSNGRIEADDVIGLVDADTSNSSIRVTVLDPPSDGSLRFDTSNGSIDVTIKRFNNNPMLLDSSNGNITLRLPESTDAEIHASTSNGNIQTDFPVTVSGELKKTELKGRLGSGGNLVRISTSNSSIRLLRD